MVTTAAASRGGSKWILRTSSKKSIRARCVRDRHRRRSEGSLQFHCHPYIEFDVQ
jgi:hypothetical protein